MKRSDNDELHPTLGVVIPGNFIPPINGGQKVCYELCSALSKQTKVYCFSAHTENTSHDLNLIHFFHTLSPVRYLNMSLVLKLKSALKRNYINYCIVNQPYFALLAFIACQLAGCKLITYAHNLEFKRTDGLKKYLRPLTYFLELTIFHLSWKIFFISETERVQACKYFFLDRNKCIYIPHIVPKADDRVQVKFETRHDPIFTLIFFGNFSYPPNKRALDTLFEHILPVLNDELTFPCKLIIFGSHLPDFSEIKQPNSHLSLEILGFVKNPTNVIRQADVMLNPVIDGAGVQTKIIESISLGTTVISTESGARGIGRVAGNKLRCIEDKNWRGFVHEIFNIRSQRLHTLKTPKSFFNTYSATSVTNTVLDSLI